MNHIEAIWARMPAEDRERVEAAGPKFRSQLIEIWDAANQNEGRIAEKEAEEQRMLADSEGFLLACIEHAKDNDWPDGKSRAQLQTVMRERESALRRLTGFQTLAALREGDFVQYNRFLDGCVRAMRRDAAISSGQLHRSVLKKMKDAELARRHHAETSDLHASFDDMSEERYL